MLKAFMTHYFFSRGLPSLIKVIGTFSADGCKVDYRSVHSHNHMFVKPKSLQCPILP